jgi:hypothetical protein
LEAVPERPGPLAEPAISCHPKWERVELIRV